MTLISERGVDAEERNKTLVLEAFDTLFNRRDYAAAPPAKP
jgi:hypothetical protein